MTPRLVAALALAAALALPATVHAADPSLRLGSTGQRVLEVEYRLRSIGYSVAVDTVFDARTDRATRHFQRASGLTPDGVIGPLTLSALTTVTATRPAVRLDPPKPQFADVCNEMSWYRQQAGLPEQFDAIGYRESGCQNDARPTIPAAACCRGWFAIHKSNIRAPGYKAGAASCGITTEADYYGVSPEQKRASACFAKVLYDVSGMSPWAL